MDHAQLRVYKINYVPVSTLPTARKKRTWPLIMISFISVKKKIKILPQL